MSLALEKGNENTHVHISLVWGRSNTGAQTPLIHSLTLSPSQTHTLCGYMCGCVCMIYCRGLRRCNCMTLAKWYGQIEFKSVWLIDSNLIGFINTLMFHICWVDLDGCMDGGRRERRDGRMMDGWQGLFLLFLRVVSYNKIYLLQIAWNSLNIDIQSSVDLLHVNSGIITHLKYKNGL